MITLEPRCWNHLIMAFRPRNRTSLPSLIEFTRSLQFVWKSRPVACQVLPNLVTRDCPILAPSRSTCPLSEGSTGKMLLLDACPQERGDILFHTDVPFSFFICRSMTLHNHSRLWGTQNHDFCWIIVTSVSPCSPFGRRDGRGERRAA